MQQGLSPIAQPASTIIPGMYSSNNSRYLLCSLSQTNGKIKQFSITNFLQENKRLAEFCSSTHCRFSTCLLDVRSKSLLSLAVLIICLCQWGRRRRGFYISLQKLLYEMICSAESKNWEKEKNECRVKHQSIKMEINCFTISSSSLLKGLFQHLNGGLCGVEWILKCLICHFYSVSACVFSHQEWTPTLRHLRSYLFPMM